MKHLMRLRFIKAKSPEAKYSDKEYTYIFDDLGFQRVPKIGQRGRITSVTGNNYSNLEVEVMNIRRALGNENICTSLTVVKKFSTTETFDIPMITEKMVVPKLEIRDNALTAYTYILNDIFLTANSVRELMKKVQKFKPEEIERIEVKASDTPITNFNTSAYCGLSIDNTAKSSYNINPSAKLTLKDNNGNIFFDGKVKDFEITQNLETSINKSTSFISNREVSMTGTIASINPVGNEDMRWFVPTAREKFVKIAYEGTGNRAKMSITDEWSQLDDNKIGINKNNNKENKEKNTMKNLIKGFDFGKYTGADIKMSIKGLAYRNFKTGTFQAYDATTNQLVDVDNFVLDFDAMLYKMPVATKDIKEGDILVHNGTFVIVLNVKENIKVIDPAAGEVKYIVPATNIFGFNFYTKIVNLMGDMFTSTATADMPFGNLMPLMLMSDNKGSDNMMETFMLMNMMNGGKSEFNPMMLMLMGGDNKKDMLPLMMMMNGGNFNFGLDVKKDA